MAMTKRDRADAFTSLLNTFNCYVHGYDGAFWSEGCIQRNVWMQQHPDLLSELMVFMTAFRAEIEQRFEEQG